MNMKRIAFLFLCLFVFLYSGHCQKNFDHYHLTMKAIKEGNISDFEKNIKHIKNIDSLFHTYTDHSYTLLGYACLYQNKRFVQRLIGMKANMECVYSDDMYCYDALYMAVDKGNGDYITYPLMVAVDKNNINIVKVLLKYGAKTKVKDRSGMSPLSIARRHKNVEMIKLLKKS